MQMPAAGPSLSSLLSTWLVAIFRWKAGSKKKAPASVWLCCGMQISRHATRSDGKEENGDKDGDKENDDSDDKEEDKPDDKEEDDEDGPDSSCKA